MEAGLEQGAHHPHAGALARKVSSAGHTHSTGLSLLEKAWCLKSGCLAKAEKAVGAFLTWPRCAKLCVLIWIREKKEPRLEGWSLVCRQCVALWVVAL